MAQILQHPIVVILIIWGTLSGYAIDLTLSQILNQNPTNLHFLNSERHNRQILRYRDVQKTSEGEHLPQAKSVFPQTSGSIMRQKRKRLKFNSLAIDDSLAAIFRGVAYGISSTSAPPTSITFTPPYPERHHPILKESTSEWSTTEKSTDNVSANVNTIQFTSAEPQVQDEVTDDRVVESEVTVNGESGFQIEDAPHLVTNENNDVQISNEMNVHLYIFATLFNILTVVVILLVVRVCVLLSLMFKNCIIFCYFVTLLASVSKTLFLFRSAYQDKSSFLLGAVQFFLDLGCLLSIISFFVAYRIVFLKVDVRIRKFHVSTTLTYFYVFIFSNFIILLTYMAVKNFLSSGSWILATCTTLAMISLLSFLGLSVFSTALLVFVLMKVNSSCHINMSKNIIISDLVTCVVSSDESKTTLSSIQKVIQIMIFASINTIALQVIFFITIFFRSKIDATSRMHSWFMGSLNSVEFLNLVSVTLAVTILIENTLLDSLNLKDLCHSLLFGSRTDKSPECCLRLKDYDAMMPLPKKSLRRSVVKENGDVELVDRKENKLNVQNHQDYLSLRSHKYDNQENDRKENSVTHSNETVLTDDNILSQRSSSKNILPFYRTMQQSQGLNFSCRTDVNFRTAYFTRCTDGGPSELADTECKFLPVSERLPRKVKYLATGNNSLKSFQTTRKFAMNNAPVCKIEQQYSNNFEFATNGRLFANGRSCNIPSAFLGERSELLVHTDAVSGCARSPCCDEMEDIYEQIEDSFGNQQQLVDEKRTISRI